MSDNDRIDFSVLDPTRDRATFDTEIAALLTAVGGLENGIAPGADVDGLLRQIAGWIGPALGFAVPIATIAALMLLMIGRDTPVRRAIPDWTPATGIPAQVAEWFHDGVSPPPLELLSEFDRAGAAGARHGR